MQSLQPKTYNISDFYEWHQKHTLILTPRFQRRPVWSPQARSHLIDTIIRGLPIPKIFIRQKIDLDSSQTIREVVDGQQRLRAIFDFLEGKLTISKVHNPAYCDQKYEEMPDDVKKNFLAYQLSVDVMIGASDIEVLDIFTRINSYTLVLNLQEKLNARFSGTFKQAVYNLGWDHLEFWRNNRILTEQKIARMGEAELASEIVLAMLEGLQQGKRPLWIIYLKFDEAFPQQDEVKSRFHTIIDLIAFVFGDELSKTVFRRAPLFYSLFCAFYDCKYGLPKMKLGRIPINEKTRGSILKVLIELGKQIESQEPKPEYVELRQASIRSTDKIKERTTRHEFLWNAINSAINQPN